MVRLALCKLAQGMQNGIGCIRLWTRDLSFKLSYLAEPFGIFARRQHCPSRSRVFPKSPRIWGVGDYVLVKLRRVYVYMYYLRLRSEARLARGDAV